VLRELFKTKLTGNVIVDPKKDLKWVKRLGCLKAGGMVYLAICGPRGYSSPPSGQKIESIRYLELKDLG